MQTAIGLPHDLAPLAGRIVDVDSHEMMPAQIWEDVFGSDVKELADAVIAQSPPNDRDPNSHNVPDFAGDVMEITDTLTRVKGPKAPGAVDIRRRLDVMDAMGVRRQLMFPTGLGGWAITLLCQDKYDPKMLSQVTGDRSAKASKWLKTYVEWMIPTAKVSDRIRPVPPLLGDTVDELMATARRMIDSGIRAVQLPPGILPGGKSPAHSDLDPFWALLAEARCVVTLHLGTEGKFLEPHRGWRDAPVFEGYRDVGEFSVDPWYTSVVHFPAQNFLQTMIVGGVFVRHPNLRVGVIELGAYWIAPMMESMDLWHRAMEGLSIPGKRLPMPPSAYLKQNVRVSVFSFEDLGSYVERGLQDVICFATDYPHIEGGRDAAKEMYHKLAPYGPEVLEKFFVTNGAFLVPD
jgi:predicted TIM-barrel fold metal-dependent hydrolase